MLAPSERPQDCQHAFIPRLHYFQDRDHYGVYKWCSKCGAYEDSRGMPYIWRDATFYRVQRPAVQKGDM